MTIAKYFYVWVDETQSIQKLIVEMEELEHTTYQDLQMLGSIISKNDEFAGLPENKLQIFKICGDGRMIEITKDIRDDSAALHREAAMTTLHKLGLTSRYQGHKFLVEAMSVLYYKRNISSTLLYKLIAEQQNTSPANVERSIRHSIITTWGKIKGRESYFQSVFPGYERKPTNREFIISLNNYIRSGAVSEKV
ncbi:MULTISPECIES: sporulation initiation factor Spo0A C-terminal domain-containing protein [Paenibacillus]|uniref:Sporulation initiation factor Spo0A C-terminal domain-containing protein n=1 Tax=Paenibacillus vandeheii TaxID=3035917 RepID=A0ABT8JFR9_9BACL|nr:MULTISPECIES: sporulation initiation factor Spo0A C-terminal domain-containing protein [Paenibacillus]KGP81383.1 hypothetical protein P363_0128245 [Paenibacillus sp. MAEPY1]KGP82019.1 hypothetical protein P364_0114500 [Paenibacillus sp. MAEPY2]MDN4603940.1 sporulation initiation factor Spo0A C-terminal domain-containing protein [Paenibacillus vandeheii]